MQSSPAPNRLHGVFGHALPWTGRSFSIGKGPPTVPAISRDEVAHLARLSRLALTDAELDEFAGQLDSILSHVKAVSEVAADDVAPMANPNAVTNVTRPDVVQPGLTPEQALSGAPLEEDGRFSVPQILGEGE
jgi:aspartyl-tRNA(Asn)/glutamyl-tRNA(Gln) amidotransferase subunit C